MELPATELRNGQPDSDPRGGAAASEFPLEPFACPACGQILAPTCRVCVACHQAIDAAEIKSALMDRAPQLLRAAPGVAARARFSWAIFFVVFGTWLLAAQLALRFFGEQKVQWVLAGIVVLSSTWVLRDALRKGIPKPWRWALGALMIWIVVFPWYLSRRRTIDAPCPLMEGKRSSLLSALLVVTLAVVAIYLAMVSAKIPK